jgi:hypothetical protein
MHLVGGVHWSHLIKAGAGWTTKGHVRERGN